jgi:hypothetical protein
MTGAWKAGEQAAGDWKQGRDQGAALARQRIKQQVPRSRWGAAPSQRPYGGAAAAAEQRVQLQGLLHDAGAQAWTASAERLLHRRPAARCAMPRVAEWVDATA